MDLWKMYINASSFVFVCLRQNTKGVLRIPLSKKTELVLFTGILFSAYAGYTNKEDLTIPLSMVELTRSLNIPDNTFL